MSCSLYNKGVVLVFTFLKQFINFVVFVLTLIMLMSCWCDTNTACQPKAKLLALHILNLIDIHYVHSPFPIYVLLFG